MNRSAEAQYPPPAFYFRVVFEGSQEDTSFQEVSGISSRMETEAYEEGGENRFTHQLPKRAAYDKLVLKRGVADAGSPLVSWCRDTLEAGLSAPVSPRTVVVSLLDETGSPLGSWSFAGAFPVKWEVGGFHSTKNEVAIESIDLSYNYFTRVA